MLNKAIITCALTGVLTDPRQHPVPVTPEEMAREAKAAYEAGAVVMHVHFRQQGPGKGHLPSWEPEVAVAIMTAIREACPGVILNQSTGTIGPDIDGPLACLDAVQPGDRRLQRRLAQLSQGARPTAAGPGRRTCSTIRSRRSKPIST